MKAFHNDPAIKAKYLARVQAHRAADEIIHGVYWQHGKGCAVGCTVHSESHAAYEEELGIPRSLARIEDGIFEGMANGESLTWPERFLEAIPVGADLSNVTAQFLFWLLVDPEDGVIRYARTNRSKKAIQDVAALYERKLKGETIESDEWWKARAAVYAAAYAAASAASAASAAAYAASAASAASAAAAYAAYAAYDASAAACDAACDADAARSNARQKQSIKLLSLLQAAK